MPRVWIGFDFKPFFLPLLLLFFFVVSDPVTAECSVVVGHMHVREYRKTDSIVLATGEKAYAGYHSWYHAASLAIEEAMLRTLPSLNTIPTLENINSTPYSVLVVELPMWSWNLSACSGTTPYKCPSVHDCRQTLQITFVWLLLARSTVQNTISIIAALDMQQWSVSLARAPGDLPVLQTKVYKVHSQAMASDFSRLLHSTYQVPP